GDPPRAAIAATMLELDRAGATFDKQTLLVAGGLGRRAGHRELEQLVPPDFARRFHGRGEGHDAEGGNIVEIPHADRPLRVHPALVETDLVVPVTAAETVLHGGPAALLAGADPQALRSANAYSLLETSGSGGWRR